MTGRAKNRRRNREGNHHPCEPIGSARQMFGEFFESTPRHEPGDFRIHVIKDTQRRQARYEDE